MRCHTTARVRRRIMTRLHAVGLVTTLHRTIGGARAGSAGHIYTLTAAGHRFQAILTGQPSPPRVKRPSTPGVLFVAHTLAISDIYVRLVAASRTHGLTVSSFLTEPHCWWPTAAGDCLKPDAYCVLTSTTHADCWWLEIDQATESLPRIRTKCRIYLDFLTHGGSRPRSCATPCDVQRPRHPEKTRYSEDDHHTDHHRHRPVDQREHPS